MDAESRIAHWTRERMKDNDASHDSHHIDAVVSWVRRICPPSLLEIGVLAAYLHDVCDSKYCILNPKQKKDLLLQACIEAGYREHVAEKAVTAALEISFSRRLSHGLPQFENKDCLIVYHVVSDADMLEAMGAIGVVRTFMYQATHSKGILDALNHVERRLFLCGDYMHFEDSKTEAHARLLTMKFLCDKLREERSLGTPI